MTVEPNTQSSNGSAQARTLTRIVLLILVIGIATAIAWIGTSDAPQVWLMQRKSTAELEKITLEDSQSAWAAYVLGGRYIRSGRQTEAITMFERARRLAPDSFDVRFTLGKAYLLKPNPVSAAAELERAAQLEPNNARVFRYLGMAQRLEGDVEGATVSEKRATAMDPKDAESWYQLGAIYYSPGTVEADGIPYLKKAAELRPDNGVYQFECGRALVDAQKFGEALPHLRQAARLLPDNPSAHFMLGLCIHHTGAGEGDLSEAIAELKKSIALYQDNFKPHFELGVILEENKKYADAYPEFETTCRLNPGLGEGWYHLSLAADRTGRPAKAVEARARYETIRKEHVELQILQKHLGEHPDDTAGRIRAGILMEHQGKLAAAASQYQGALDQSPDNRAARDAMAKLQKHIQALKGNNQSNNQP